MVAGRQRNQNRAYRAHSGQKRVRFFLNSVKLKNDVFNCIILTSQFIMKISSSVRGMASIRMGEYTARRLVTSVALPRMIRVWMRPTVEA